MIKKIILFCSLFILFLCSNVLADTNISPKSGLYGIAGGDHDVPNVYTNYTSNSSYGTAIIIPDGKVELGLIRYYTYFNSGVVTSANSYTYKYKVCGGSIWGMIGTDSYGTVGDSELAWSRFKSSVSIYGFMYNTSSEAITGASQGDTKKLVSEVQQVSGQNNCIYHVISFTPESSYRAVGFFVKYNSQYGWMDGDSNDKITVTLVSLTQKEGVGGIVKNQTDKIIEEQQKQNQKLEDIDNSINDESSPDDELEQTINDISSDIPAYGPVASIITMPINLYTAYFNQVDGTCHEYNFGSLYGTDLKLPCLNLQQKLGNNLWGIIDSFFSIFMIYNICMLIFSCYTSFVNLDDSFQSLYTPQHGVGGRVQRGEMEGKY